MDNETIGDNQAIRVHQAIQVVKERAEAEGVAAAADGLGGMAITVLMAPMVLPAGSLLRMETPEILEAMEDTAKDGRFLEMLNFQKFGILTDSARITCGMI